MLSRYVLVSRPRWRTSVGRRLIPAAQSVACAALVNDGRGPTLLEDFHLREKIFHFDHERIPERVVHARGYGAHGYFENYGPLADVTRADLFQRKGEKTLVFVRFSTVAGNKGSATPFSNFQQDGHMAMHNPKGRANYEPNSWGDAGGPRESPETGFQSYPEPVEGSKLRARSETFSDHYSQARQFYISQTEIEQRHIGNALTFELSKAAHPSSLMRSRSFPRKKARHC
jgi:catalase